MVDSCKTIKINHYALHKSCALRYINERKRIISEGDIKTIHEENIRKQTRILSDETRKKISDRRKGIQFSEKHRRKIGDAHKGKIISETTRRKVSAALQGISYDEWEDFAVDSPYCPAFNEACRESNREKYGRRCFICGLPEAENITKTGKQKKLSVHHVDMNKNQGCDGHEWKLVPLCMNHHSHGVVWTERIKYLLRIVWC